MNKPEPTIADADPAAAEPSAIAAAAAAAAAAEDAEAVEAFDLLDLAEHRLNRRTRRAALIIGALAPLVCELSANYAASAEAQAILEVLACSAKDYLREERALAALRRKAGLGP